MGIGEIEAEHIAWRDFAKLVLEGELRSQEGWIFKGSRTPWILATYLERVALARWGIEPRQMPELERRMLRDFQRRFPRDVGYLPEPDDTLEWLALMQHYGAPTRLLDWTYSPFVAAYFAFDYLLQAQEPTPEGEVKAEIWAVNQARLFDPALRRPKLPQSMVAALSAFVERRNVETFEGLFMSPEGTEPFVWPVNPFNLNERLNIQQGLFLCAGDISRTFLENLEAMIPEDVQGVRRFQLPAQDLPDAFEQLERMNLNTSTLFPGIEGFARSFVTRLPFLLDRPHSTTEEMAPPQEARRP